MQSQTRKFKRLYQRLVDSVQKATLRYADDIELARKKQFADWGGKNPMPFTYKSQNDMYRHLSMLGEAWEQAGEKRVRSNMSVSELMNIIAANVAFTCCNETGRAKDGTVYVYNYDTGLYELLSIEDVSAMMLAVTGSMDVKKRANVLSALESGCVSGINPTVPYEEAPSWFISCGNGIYDLLHKRFVERSPIWILHTGNSTDYVPEALNTPAEEMGGFTFDRLLSEFANNNPQRIRLLEEVWLTVVTAISPQDASFIVRGRGGDGKSTFFGAMESVIGRENTSHVNFTDMEKDDKALAMMDATVNIGDDNDDNLTIARTAHFKQTSTHGPMTLSRKYQKATTCRFRGTSFQLVNEYPRFTSMNDATRRRIVPISAENQFVKSPRVRKNLGKVLSSKKMREHLLASALSKPFRADFNQVDASVYEEAASMDDAVIQFVDHLVSNGVLSRSVEFLPRVALYAAYLDWSTETGFTAQQYRLSSATFSHRIEGILEKYGFRAATSLGTVRLTAMTGHFDADGVFGELADGPMLSDVIKKNRPTRWLKRVEDIEPTTVRANSAPARRDYDCLFFEYAGLDTTDLRPYIDASMLPAFDRMVDDGGHLPLDPSVLGDADWFDGHDDDPDGSHGGGDDSDSACAVEDSDAHGATSDGDSGESAIEKAAGTANAVIDRLAHLGPSHDTTEAEAVADEVRLAYDKLHEVDETAALGFAGRAFEVTRRLFTRLNSKSSLSLLNGILNAGLSTEQALDNVGRILVDEFEVQSKYATFAERRDGTRRQ